MFRWTPLHRSALFDIACVCCTGHDARQPREECVAQPSLVLPRSGAFLRRDRHGRRLADPNHALFFGAGLPYTATHPVAAPDTCLSLTPRADVLADLLATLGLEPEAYGSAACTHAAHSPLSQALLLRLERSLATGDALAVDEAALDLLARLIGQRAGARTPRRTRAPRRDDVAWAVAAQVQARVAERVTLAELAQSVQLSPFALLRAFRAEFGCGVHAYQLRLRLARALHLMADRRRALADIALEAGFCDQSHFANAFARRYGAAPARVRAGALPEARA